MEWRSARECERRTSVRKEKRYDRNKGVVSERGSGQSGEWRLIRDWNDESNQRDPRRWRDGGYKRISRGELFFSKLHTLLSSQCCLLHPLKLRVFAVNPLCS